MSDKTDELPFDEIVEELNPFDKLGKITSRQTSLGEFFGKDKKSEVSEIPIAEKNRVISPGGSSKKERIRDIEQLVEEINDLNIEELNLLDSSEFNSNLPGSPDHYSGQNDQYFFKDMDKRIGKNAGSYYVVDPNDSIDLTDYQKEILRMYIGEMKGMKAIGKIIHSDPRTFKKHITSTGIKIPFPGSIWKKMQDHYSYRFYIEHDKQLDDIIRGSILGDVQIRLQSKRANNMDMVNLREYEYLLRGANGIRDKMLSTSNIGEEDIELWNQASEYMRNINTACFRVHKSIFELDWVKVLAKEFENNGYGVTPYVKKAKTVREDQELRWSCGFDTSSSVQMFSKWLNWYTYNSDGSTTKSVPSTLPKISPDTLLHWYTGDGGFLGRDKGILHLYTNCFPKNEQQKIVKSFENINFYPKIVSVIKNGNKEYFLRFPSDKISRDDFFDFLSDAKLYNKAIETLPHKFDISITRTDIINKLKLKTPEFFDKNAKLSWDKLS